ncbi:MAG TPA: tetratricopeptide repeat protein [Deltaproteobacteria bacterium]|nr:tetratricopeptide repeat protein [Deltaproteobacteria bacterium]
MSFDEPEDEDALAYVSYDRDGNVEEDASTRAGEPRKANQFTDVGADALVTLDGRTPDLGAALGSSLLDEPSVELEHAPDPDAFEDDAATIVKPSPADSLYGGGRHNTGQGAQAGVSTARASTPAAPSTPPPKRVTSGLYGGSSVPTIRDSKDSSRPRAAAIQLNSGGTGGRVLGLEEEEEPIAVGGADEDHEVHHGGGFSLSLQESEHDDYEDDYEEEEEEPDRFEEEAVIAHAIPVPAGPTPEEIAEIFARAQAAAAAGQLHQGAELYSDVIDADPDHVAAHVARGRLYLDLGDYSRAMSDFIVSEGIAADSPEPQVAIGDLYFARKDYRKAIEYFNAALEMSPNHAMAFCRRGVSHYHRKNYQEALNDLLKAQRIQPDIPNITTYVSMAKKKKGRR